MMIYTSNPIFKRDSSGKLRIWRYEVDGNKYRTIAGIHGGSLVTAAWTVCKPKNVGRSNETTAEEQALEQAQSEEKKKLDREYRRTAEELDAVPASPMLAKDFAAAKNLAFPVFSQPKLDGIRALINRHGAFSREYQKHPNVDHIMEALAPAFYHDPDITLDGELYNHSLRDNFNEITSLVRRSNGTPEENAKARDLIQFHVYDIIVPDTGFELRSAALSGIVQNLGNSSVVFVPTIKATSQAALDEAYGQYLVDGYEGQMVRLDKPYEIDKRSASLLKRKEFLTAEFRLLRVEEGVGNWAGAAKRAVFALPDGREFGAGIKGTRENGIRLLKEVPAWGEQRQGTVRYFTPTPDGIPRFPVAIDFHPDGRRD